MSPLQYRPVHINLKIFFFFFFCAEIPHQTIVKSASDAEIPLPRKNRGSTTLSSIDVESESTLFGEFILHQLDIDVGLGSIWHGEFMLLHCEVLMREHNDVESLYYTLKVEGLIWDLKSTHATLFEPLSCVF